MTTLTIKGTELSQDMLNQKSTAELATVYNATMAEIDPAARKIERFATKEAAVRRVWGAFVQLAALEQTRPAEDKPAKVKKAKTPKEPKAKAEGSARGQRSTFSGKQLTATVEENPRREGTHGHRSMAIIIANPGITYEDYIAQGGRNNDLRWDIDFNRVRVEG